MSFFRAIKSFRLCFVLLLFSATASDLWAANTEEKASFDLKEMIFSHLSDSYDWHLITLGEKEISIPLPVIVRSDERGWFVFLSSRFEHGHAAYMGFRISNSERYNGKIVELGLNGEELRPFDLSMTKNVVSILLTAMLLLLIFLPLARAYRKEPLRSRRGFSGSMEMLIMAIYNDVIKPCVGKDYKKFAPYLLTAFFFIFLSNLLGLIPLFPGGANVTGNISVTFALALCTFLITNFFGTREYWREIFWPDVPFLLKLPLPIMPFVEILGIFTKPFALMVRLFANMMAGHMIILVLAGLIFIFYALLGAAASSAVSILSLFFSIFMLTLDVLISFIQAYVFTMLSAIFIGMARVEHHKH